MGKKETENRNITLDAIRQLASIYMNHHRNKQQVTIYGDSENKDYDIIISINRVPKQQQKD